MAIEFPCQNPQCGKKMKAPAGTAGRKARCPLCKTVQVIPAPAPPPPPEPPAVDDSLLGFSDEDLAEESAEPSLAGADRCEDCGAEMGGAILCPNCGWIRPDAAGEPLPAQKHALADDEPGTARAAPESLASGCLRAIFYGTSNFRSLLKLVFYSLILFIALYMIMYGMVLMACMGILGLLVFGAVMVACSLTFWGYFLRFYLDCSLSSLEGVNVAPDVPEFDFKELFFVGLKGLGVACVYIAPVITLPLLPLGLLAWAHSADHRAFDLRWSFRAAVRKPGALALTWVFILLWGVVGYVAVWLASLLAGLLVAAIGSMFGGLLGVLVVLAIQIFPMMVVAALYHMFNSMIFRCIGMLGRYHSDLLELPPENTSPGVAAGFITGGVLVTIVEFVAVVTLGALAALSSLGSIGPEEQLDPGPGEVARDDGQDAQQKAAAARRKAQRKQQRLEAERKRKAREQQAPAPQPAESAVAKVPQTTPPPAPADLTPMGYLQTVVRSKDRGKLSRAVQNLRSVGQAVRMYQLEHDRFPENLAELVQAGVLPEKLLASPGTEERELVYLKPALALPRGDSILVFDPVAYMNNRIPVVRVNGQASHVDRKSLLRQLNKQGVK